MEDIIFEPRGKYFKERISTVWEKEAETDLSNFSGNYFPKKMHLSLTSHCNLRCEHCYRSHGSVKSNYMSREMLGHIINDFFPKICAIRIGGSDCGEQVLSPDFEYCLEAIRKYSIDLELVTNATAVTDRNARLIVSADTQIFISLEGIGTNYEKIRNFKWSRFIKNIDLLKEAKLRIPNARASINLLVTP